MSLSPAVFTAAALATCVASALMVAVVQVTLDSATRQRLGTGLLWTALGLLLFAGRLVSGLRPDLVAAAVQGALGIAAALFVLFGIGQLLAARQHLPAEAA
jgi:uncharacterized membrane protein